MRALILVGGFGTRLRPLTLSTPKPLVPFANKPMVRHQIEALAKVGVTKVVLAINYQAEKMTAQLQPIAEELGVEIVCSEEEFPLGTAGPIKLAEDHLREGDEPFFVLNSDVTCEFPFAELLAFHKERGAEGTIMVTKVDEPSKYGVVLYDKQGKIEDFIEKPKEFVGNRINAGIYIFSPKVFDYIGTPGEPLQETSIEKEVFPVMADKGTLFCMDLKGYWMDVGQPKDYLTGMGMYLTYLAKTQPEAVAPKSSQIIGPVLLHPTAQIGEHCLIGPHVVIGPNVRVGDGTRISRSTLLENSSVGKNSWIHSTIVGWDSSIGSWVRTDNVTVLGEDVRIKDELYINGARILPHKGIKASIPEPAIIM